MYFWNLLVDRQHFKHHFNVNPINSNLFPQSCDLLQWLIDLLNVHLKNNKVTNGKLILQNMRISKHQGCTHSSDDNTTLHNLKKPSAVHHFYLSFFVLHQWFIKSFRFMLFGIEIFHSLEIYQRINRFLVIPWILHCFIFEVFGSPFIYQIVCYKIQSHRWKINNNEFVIIKGINSCRN